MSLEPIINAAIEELFENDKELIDNEMEWATAHRLAVYLEKNFDGWNIDCEYNKMTHDFVTKHNSENNYKRPDIVVHHRGEISAEDNLLVIEIKMRSGHDDDETKLLDFTSPPNQHRPFQYQYGLKISFLPSVSLKWFQDGEEIT